MLCGIEVILVIILLSDAMVTPERNKYTIESPIIDMSIGLCRDIGSQ